MRTLIKSLAFTAALSLLPASAAPAFALAPVAAQDQDRDRDHANHVDYSHNEYYRLGNREGYEDYQRKAQRKEHNHQFHSDDDRRAHDTGYQEGWQGRRYHADDNNYQPH